jgi:hypothetical protein
MKDTKTLRALHRRLKKYGISETTFWALIHNQGGLCAICKSGSATDIDHCHETNAVRGILCMYCNRGLGQFEDSPDRLRAAAFYLENPTPLTKMNE